MRPEPPRRPSLVRALLAVCVSLVGIVAIVGSGGGSLGFPPCGDICNEPEPPPTPSAAIAPDRYTALVGTPASFTVTTANVSGSLAYQWQRSDDGGTSYADIAGETSATYAIPSVNLADDKAVLRVQVRVNGVPAFAPNALLAVSAVPGIVFQDTELLAGDWSISPVPGDNGVVPMQVTESLASGGNPGAFRKMTFQIPAGTGSARVFFSSLASTYDPATEGAVYVIDYAEDCTAFQPTDLILIQSSLVLEQSGRRFLSNNFEACTGTTWRTVVNRASLAPADFRLFDGAACATGEACPDFSASAAPMRFGYWRIVFTTPGQSAAHGIDNWKVTVWKR
jgi:hypothetical protein